MRIVLLLVFCSSFVSRTFSQENAKTQFTTIDASIGVGSKQYSLALSMIKNWKVGKKKRFGIGVGGRVTSYTASDQYYVTAPAKLTSGETGPLIIFKDNIDANIDSFFVKSPQVNAINASITMDYQLSRKLTIAFNIDIIGFSFGASKQGTYLNGNVSKPDNALPTSFNILLVSDNDRGSLNSEFAAKYALNKDWALRLGLQFLFTEYTTSTNVQQFPEPNNRFRNKSLMPCFGVSYTL